MTTYTNTFLSGGRVYPWLQLEIECSFEVERLVVNNRPDCCGEWFTNVGIHVGDQTAVAGQLVDSQINPLCATFEGPSVTAGQYSIPCTQLLIGKYVILQIKAEGVTHLQVNEVTVFSNTQSELLKMLLDQENHIMFNLLLKLH